MIEARGLVKHYRSTLAVDNLSFDVRPGTVTGFLGPNGAGKLKDRVARVGEFLDALDRVARGATVLDPQVIAQLLAGQRQDNALGALTAREWQLLALMAEGHSNTAIAQQLVISASAVEKHISNVFAKLGLPPDDAQHLRVLAVLAYLRA